MSPQEKKKQKMLDRVADDNGVAIVVLDENSNEVSASNNNSICRALWASSEFRPRCNEYCGVAFEKHSIRSDVRVRMSRGTPVRGRAGRGSRKTICCDRGTVLQLGGELSQGNDRSIVGDWKQFSPNEFFENVLIAGSLAAIDRAASELSKYQVSPSQSKPDQPNTKPIEPRVEAKVEPRVESKPRPEPQTQKTKPPQTDVITDLIEKFKAKTEAEKKPLAPPTDARRIGASALRALYGKLASLSYEDACLAVLEFIAGKTGRESFVWMERKDDRLIPVASTGSLNDPPIKIGIVANNKRLVEASRQERPIELRERIIDADEKRAPRTLHIWASTVGGEIRGAIGVEGSIDEAAGREVALFCRRIGPEIEILKLRREVSTREWLNRAVSRFNDSLKRIDAEDFWTQVTQVSAELVQSERASLLLQNEQSEGFKAKASIGAKINLFSEPGVGERISKLVLDDGNPVIVEDITQIGIKAAPANWRYKTSSFLSYPILIGERRIGVLNFTDKANGGAFNERDLELLQAIAPQIAVAIDRTVLKDKAGEFEQLSVTDPLTGLLNRRYLEKRLVEEIQRSKRHRFPMSLLMVDVDEFKSYNDMFGHPAGDIALKIVANALQDILRGDDIAARYGGEGVCDPAPADGRDGSRRDRGTSQAASRAHRVSEASGYGQHRHCIVFE
jgi:GGDEF domain-containing protein